jgi:hypothetical protein
MERVVETPGYLALARKLLSEKEMADIVSLLAADPKAGDVMEGTGGSQSTYCNAPGKAVVPALFTSSATQNIRYFSSPFFRRTRKATFPRRKGMPSRNVPIRFLILTERHEI